jgi:hypothetical protein
LIETYRHIDKVKSCHAKHSFKATPVFFPLHFICAKVATLAAGFAKLCLSLALLTDTGNAQRELTHFHPDQ